MFENVILGRANPSPAFPGHTNPFTAQSHRLVVNFKCADITVRVYDQLFPRFCAFDIEIVL